MGLAMFAGLSIAQAQDVQYHPPLSAELVARAQARIDSPAGAAAKDYNYNGALDLVGNGGFSFDNNAGTVYQYFDRLENDSSTYSSGSIRIMLFVTQAPIVPGAGFSYWIVTTERLDSPPISHI